MPKYDVDPRFRHDLRGLSDADLRAFIRAKDRFVAALKANSQLPAGLNIHLVAGHPGLYEMRFSDTRRAVFEYLTSERGDAAHVYWRRIGGHDIYDRP